VSQANYSTAKAGIAAFSIVAAAELGRYGIMVNTIAPSARSRMTEDAFAEMMAKPAEGFDKMAPENVSPLVVWLGSAECEISGRAFEVAGGELSLADGWQHGAVFDKGARWEPGEIGSVVRDLLVSAPAPAPVYGAS
jgi:NAD(P)-dependent dehydrogenase (short-subunit alcohol dehydrogenase family)